MNTESMQVAPAITSSLVTAAARLPWLVRSAWSLMLLVMALRSPDSWVPPSGVGMVLQYDDTNGSMSATKPIAHSTVPWPLFFSDLPAKISGCTSVAPLMVALR